MHTFSLRAYHISHGSASYSMPSFAYLAVSRAGAMMEHMAVILEKDLKRGHDALVQWRAAALELADTTPHRLTTSPVLPRPVWAMAVRYSLFLLERRAPGPGVEVRVAPWGAVKILDGPESDPHNLTPPDVIELDPEVWLRLACGITTWAEEKDAGHISAVGERDDLSDLLPL